MLQIVYHHYRYLAAIFLFPRIAHISISFSNFRQKPSLSLAPKEPINQHSIQLVHDKTNVLTDITRGTRIYHFHSPKPQDPYASIYLISLSKKHRFLQVRYPRGIFVQIHVFSYYFVFHLHDFEFLYTTRINHYVEILSYISDLYMFYLFFLK